MCYKDTTTFNDLVWYMNHLHGLKIDQVPPEEFLSNGPLPEYQYINLVTNRNMRRSISEFMENQSIDKFTFIADDRLINIDSIGFGCFIYPGVTIYPSAIIENNVIIHANVGIAHNVIVRQGCFISGGCVITGKSIIDKHCWLSAFTIVSGPVTMEEFTKTNLRSLIVDHTI